VENDCVGFGGAAQSEVRPVDIVMAVDNSGSMRDEANAVQANLNNFSQQISGSGIDVRVVLISSYPDEGHGICVDPPLGAGGCHDHDDSNPPAFLHVDQYVGSHDALGRLLEHAPTWMPLVREEADLHVMVVTDDESNLDAASFDAQFKALGPEYTDYSFHGIVSMHNCADAANVGHVYIALGELTGGLVSDLCLQDFQPVFDRLATEVIMGATLPCEWAIPDPPEGETFDPDQVNVEFDDGSGDPLVIGRVEGPAECASVSDGWYYDDPVSPTTILACPQTCDRMQGAMTAEISIQLGCATVPAG
jgi:hypothetical protein